MISAAGAVQTDKLDARALRLRLARLLAIDLWRWRTGRGRRRPSWGGL